MFSETPFNLTKCTKDDALIIGDDEIPAKILRFPVFERENGIFSNHAFPGKFPRKLLISRHFSRQFREFYTLHFFLFFSLLESKREEEEVYRGNFFPQKPIFPKKNPVF